MFTIIRTARAGVVISDRDPNLARQHPAITKPAPRRR